MLRRETKEKNCVRGETTRRSSVTSTLSLLILAIIIMLSHCSPITEVGTIEYKLITGTSDNELHIIMHNTGREIFSIDNEYKNFISVKGGNLVVDKALEDEIKSAYSNITYRISICLSSNNETVTLTASKDIFNNLKVGSTAKFEINRSKRNTIERLVHERYNELYDRAREYAPIAETNYY
ncbi:MAG: hypothetical protein JSV97_08260 [candidate division WOR-3 bacterium]|nr:MAG: hypothetical protein JSV97_08260 [candidate division WOR-3 bacterium]